MALVGVSSAPPSVVDHIFIVPWPEGHGGPKVAASVLGLAFASPVWPLWPRIELFSTGIGNRRIIIELLEGITGHVHNSM